MCSYASTRITGPDNITEMCHEKFENLPNLCKNSQVSHPKNTITVTEDRIWLTSQEINDAIGTCHLEVE